MRSGASTSRPRRTSLEVYIGYLRRKTEASEESRLIHTVRGVGYVSRDTTMITLRQASEGLRWYAE